MSWRRLLAVGYALLVEGLDSDGRAQIDRVLDPENRPAPTAHPDAKVATPDREWAFLRSFEQAEVGGAA